jgi:hypothetical protein
VARESDQLRERARRCRSLAWGHDDTVGERLIELAVELEARADQLDREEAAEAPAPTLRPA